MIIGLDQPVKSCKVNEQPDAMWKVNMNAVEREEDFH